MKHLVSFSITYVQSREIIYFLSINFNSINSHFNFVSLFFQARQTQHKLSYSFNSEKRNSDDFDMTLIVGHVEDQVKFGGI